MNRKKKKKKKKPKQEVEESSGAEVETKSESTEMIKKLESGRFRLFPTVKKAYKANGLNWRYLNEQLYTMSGSDAFEMFKNDPESFNVYHSGFAEQVISRFLYIFMIPKFRPKSGQITR